jgi:tripartite-type tricarboxylate transporter receptor subunit TctC
MTASSHTCRACRAAASIATAVTLTAGIASHAHAQAYPSRQVKMIVPFPAGGSTDIMARLIAAEMSKTLGQIVVVDNRGGASGAIGADAVAKSAPDGYTFCYCTTGALAILPFVDAKLPYNPTRDLAPVTHVINQNFVIVARNDLPANNVRELVAHARQNKLAFGSPGSLTPSHLTGELFSAASGAQLLHVPYKGDQLAIIDLLGGRLDLMFQPAVVVKPQIDAGKMKAIGISSLTRLPSMPNVPTIAESGFPGFETHNFNAIFVPAGTPPAIIARLQAEAVAALKAPAVAERINADGLIAIGSTPRELAESLRLEAEAWAKVIRATGSVRD